MAIRQSLLAASSLCCAASPAYAQDPQLIALVQRQAETISHLEARIATLEAKAAAAPAVAQPPASNVVVNWKDGAPTFSSPDGGFTFHPRGRIFVDMSATSGSRFSERNIAGTEFRSLRLGADGKFDKHIGYQLEVELADGDAVLKSTYVSWLDKIGSVDVELSAGNRLNDRGIDGASGDQNVRFLDRNMVATGILPEKGLFGVGLMARAAGSNWHASLNAVGDDSSSAGNIGDNLTLIGRATWSPIKFKDGFIHLGAWGFTEDYAKGASPAKRAISPSARFNDNLRISSGDIRDPHSSKGYGLELGAVAGPFWATGEYAGRRLRAFADSYDFTAHSFAAGWFITGEAPPLSPKLGTWGAVKPKRPLTQGGPGAIELATKWERIDFTEAPAGGKGDVLTAGINWYVANPLRLTLNWAHYDIFAPTGIFAGKDEGDQISMRAQLVF